MRWATTLAGVAALAVAVCAQDEQQPAPTFRSEANYVQLPVRVLDARGEFVGGLTQADFQVFEDGTAQTITAFSAVDIPFTKSDETVPDAPVAARRSGRVERPRAGRRPCVSARARRSQQRAGRCA